MRNIEPSSMTIDDSLSNYKKGLHKEITKDGVKQRNPCYDVYQSEKDTLLKYFSEYNANTKPCSLECLKSHYDDKNTRDALYGMYNRSRKYMQDEWEKVAKKDGELLMCPICGIRPVKDLDHYIPRSIMPEYSIHIQNLIPTYDDCNGKKKKKWLEDGKRLYFNAYYDDAPDLGDVLDVSLAITKDLPSISISLKNITDETPENVRIVYSTIRNLELIDLYWRAKAKELVMSFVNQCISRVNVRRKYDKNISAADVWKEEKEILVDVVGNLKDSNSIEKLVFQNIIVSDDFEKWFIAL